MIMKNDKNGVFKYQLPRVIRGGRDMEIKKINFKDTAY